jgi:hypothetical protein
VIGVLLTRLLTAGICRALVGRVDKAREERCDLGRLVG